MQVHTSEFKCTKKHLKNACLSEPENEITEKHTEPVELVGQNHQKKLFNQNNLN